MEHRGPGKLEKWTAPAVSCALIRDWIERLLPTLSEQGWKLPNETREQIQCLCACNDVGVPC